MSKFMKRISALFLAMVMIMAMGITAFAQDKATGAGGQASITISNAAKGETYSVYKLFDATVTGTTDGSIAYTGTIPDSLTGYFEADSAGNVSVKANVNNMQLFAALKTWASTATAVASEMSTGGELKFTGLQYGYYVITSTQDGGNAITVDSTNPNATVVDKNKTTPIKNLSKSVNGSDVNIGDTVTYTVSFETANYNGEGADAKQIKSYTITDTLPDFLTNVTVTKITIGNTEYKVNGTVPQFDATSKSITIPWVNGGANLYANGAEIEITYTATVADTAAIDGAGNANTVTITFQDEDGNGGKGRTETDTETIYTYAIAIQKVNEKAEGLAGATFQLPFYVKSATAPDGAYVYAGTTAGEGLTNSVTTPEGGLIVIKGVKSGSYTLTETAAPNGYNKLTDEVTATASKTSETTTSKTIYLDADGNVTDKETATSTTVTSSVPATVTAVVNHSGTELPTTGGMGTTLLYVGGGVLALAAIALLIVRRAGSNR